MKATSLAKVTYLPKSLSSGVDPMSNRLSAIKRATRSVRALSRAAVFFLKVFPMLPSQPVDWVTKPPMVEKVRYPTCNGYAEGDFYRPATGGPHPGILVCLGVVPFGVDHPQVSVLGKALARAGFAALLYWSPAMRDFRLDPEDNENIPLAYRWLIQQPCVDPARSGLLGTCVGGSFALMAAASPLVRERVAFVGAYAPFSSMWTFARDIASGTRATDGESETWKVDPLTHKVFVHSLTAWLEPAETEQLRSAFAAQPEGLPPAEPFDSSSLSADGQAVFALLTARSPGAADAALHQLPLDLQERLTAMSPLHHIANLRAPLISLLHDVGDQVIPIGESRRLRAALNGPAQVDFVEMHFSHLDPVKGKLPFFSLVKELGKFFFAVYPLFEKTTW